MFELTGKPEIDVGGQASDDARSHLGQHPLIKLHPGLLTPGAGY
jgi:hypothetical protein